MMRGNFGLLKIINENKIVVNARAAEYDNNKILILTKDTLLKYLQEKKDATIS